MGKLTARAAQPAKPAPVHRESIRVLLVEDSPEDAELIRHTLERGGYRLTSERVDTREDLLAALERCPWEIVLSDYAMPGATGTTQGAGNDASGFNRGLSAAA